MKRTDRFWLWLAVGFAWVLLAGVAFVFVRAEWRERVAAEQEELRQAEEQELLRQQKYEAVRQALKAAKKREQEAFEEKNAALKPLWEEVAALYKAKGYTVDETRIYRFITVRVSHIAADSLGAYGLMKLAEEGRDVWKAKDDGLVFVLIKRTDGEYLAEADAFGSKSLLE